jgi:hypothetical protein
MSEEEQEQKKKKKKKKQLTVLETEKVESELLGRVETKKLLTQHCYF